MHIDIAHVAKLVKLSLSPDEEKAFAKQLPAILDYVEQLTKVDTTGIEAAPYLSAATNVFRPDVATPVDAATRAALITAFPKSSAGLLEVPAVFADDEPEL